MVTIEAEEGEAVERMKGVVASHLDRFAFREAPLRFDHRVARGPETARCLSDQEETNDNGR